MKPKPLCVVNQIHRKVGRIQRVISLNGVILYCDGQHSNQQQLQQFNNSADICSAHIVSRGDHRTARAVLEAIIAFSAMHTFYEQLLQVKQICLCLTGFTSLCLDAYVFLCSLVFHCMHVVLL